MTEDKSLIIHSSVRELGLVVCKEKQGSLFQQERLDAHD